LIDDDVKVRWCEADKVEVECVDWVEGRTQQSGRVEGLNNDAMRGTRRAALDAISTENVAYVLPSNAGA
jgi:hypothetical protein